MNRGKRRIEIDITLGISKLRIDTRRYSVQLKTAVMALIRISKRGRRGKEEEKRRMKKMLMRKI